MINRLINMEVKMPSKGNISAAIALNPTNYSIQEYVSAFLSGLGDSQRDRFKQMIQIGIKSGMSIAESYGIDYDDFITEVKKQLNMEE